MTSSAVAAGHATSSASAAEGKRKRDATSPMHAHDKQLHGLAYIFLVTCLSLDLDDIGIDTRFQLAEDGQKIKQDAERLARNKKPESSEIAKLHALGPIHDLLTALHPITHGTPYIRHTIAPTHLKIYEEACNKIGEAGREALRKIAHLPMDEAAPYRIHLDRLSAKGTDSYKTRTELWLESLSEDYKVV